MTCAYAYDLGRVHVALADATKAVDALAARAVPDWMAHRLATFKAEATSLADAMKEHQQEHEEDNR